MAELTAYLRRRWREIYHRSSIQVILSLFFTAVAVVGMVFLGLTLFLGEYLLYRYDHADAAGLEDGE